jgi:Uncharacterized conserved protein
MNKITVKAVVNAPVAEVWDCWITPEDIICWNNASNDWHTPRAEVDLRKGGRFLSRMEAKDGSFGFDFGGTYTQVELHKRIDYTMDDKRTVSVTFESQGNETLVSETFDPEGTNSLEMQQAGWQAILDNFKKYVDSKVS